MIKKIINNIFFIYNKLFFKNFFSKSLITRQIIIKKRFNHKNINRIDLKFYNSIDSKKIINLKHKKNLFFLIEQYLKFKKINSFGEIGVISAMMTRYLIFKLKKIKIFLYDLSSERLKILSRIKIFRKAEIKQIDLEDIYNKKYFNYKFPKFLYFGYVISSIQPESVDKIFKFFYIKRVQYIAIADIDYKKIRSKKKLIFSYSSKVSPLNWTHDYVKYSKNYYKLEKKISYIRDPSNKVNKNNSLWILKITRNRNA